jgi:hypothetical protein
MTLPARLRGSVGALWEMPWGPARLRGSVGALWEMPLPESARFASSAGSMGSIGFEPLPAPWRAVTIRIPQTPDEKALELR